MILGSRIVIMRLHPGWFADILDVPLARLRDPLFQAFEDQKRRVLASLDATFQRRQRGAERHVRVA